MSPEKDRLRPYRALTHPLWLASLVVLVVNDHVLKGSGWAPSLLTGKISDFAGLIAAPPLLATFLRVRQDRGLVASWTTVAVAFTALKTSAYASAIYERILSVVHAHNVVDPTDLMALVALPIGFWILRRAMVRGATMGRAHRLAAMVGAVACVATQAPRPPPCPPGTYSGAGGCEEAFQAALFVGNRGTTTTNVSVRVLSPGAGFRCADLDRVPQERYACALGADKLGPAQMLSLRPTENARIDGKVDTCAIAVISLDDWHTPALLVRPLATPGAEELVPYAGVVKLASGVYVDVAAGAVQRSDDGPAGALMILPFVCPESP